MLFIRNVCDTEQTNKFISKIKPDLLTQYRYITVILLFYLFSAYSDNTSTLLS